MQEVQVVTENNKADFEDKIGRVAAKLRREKSDLVWFIVKDSLGK